MRLFGNEREDRQEIKIRYWPDTDFRLTFDILKVSNAFLAFQAIT
jgi:hypothetical protein